MDSKQACVIAEQLYQDLTAPQFIQARMKGGTLKLVIVSSKFEGMDMDERFDFLWPVFERSELAGKFLISFEPYTPTEANDSGFGSGDFGDSNSGKTGTNKIAAKPAEA